MASSLIGSLRVALSLGTAEFEAGANKAASVAKSKAKEIEGAFNSAKTAVSGLFAAFSVGLLTEQIKKSLDYAGSIAEVSRTLGVTTKDLQTFRYAATQTGVSQDQLEVGLRRLTVSMGKAELGSKAQQKAFGALGITVEDLKGKTTGDVFRMMSDSLSKVTDRSQRAAVEMTLMGRSGSTLDNLLAPGTARLNELAKAAQELGIVLSDHQIQSAEETAHKLEAVKTVLAANIAGVVADNAKAIYSFADSLAHLIAQLPNAVQLLKSFYGTFLQVSAATTALIDQTIQLTPFGGGVMHQNRVANVKADSAAAGAIDEEVRRQKLGGFFAQIDARFGQTPHGVAPKSTGADLPQFLGGGGGAGRTRHEHAPKDKNEQDEFEFAQQMRQQDLQILQAKQALSHDYVEQTTLSIQMLDIEKAIRDAEIDHKVAQAKLDFAQKKITASTLAQIESEAKIEKAKENELDGLKRRAVLEAEQEQHFKDVAALDQQQLDLRKSHLDDELALATTAQERRALELKILDVDYQIQKAKLEEVLADKQSSDQAKELAQRQLTALNQDQGIKRQGVLQQTQGPLEGYLNGLPTTAAKWQEAIQGVAVNGFGALEQAILDTVSGTKKLGAAFADMAKSIIADIIKISLEKSIIAPLANALFPQAASGGGLGGGLLGSLLGGAGAAGAGAASGALSAGDMAFMSDTLGLMGFADGGFVSGRGSPTSDSIPAMLSNGEFVMNSGAVRSFGSPFFDAMNTGKIKPSDLHGAGGGSGGGLGFLKYLSPLAMLATSKHPGNFLKFLSPGAFLASKIFHFAEGGMVGGLSVPRANFGGMHLAYAGGGGSSGNVHINAPITITSPVSRDTAGQIAQELNVRIAQSRRKGF